MLYYTCNYILHFFEPCHVVSSRFLCGEVTGNGLSPGDVGILFKHQMMQLK